MRPENPCPESKYNSRFLMHNTTNSEQDNQALADETNPLKHPNFKRYLTGAFLGNTGLLMETTAIAWDLYERTGDPKMIGMIGLVQVIPVILLALPAGHIADAYDRRKVLMAAQSIVVTATLALAVVSLMLPIQVILPLYGCLMLSAIGRAFAGPTRSALVPLLVPAKILPTAIKWTSGTFQATVIIGPALAGLIIWLTHSATVVYFITFGCCLTYLLCVYSLKLAPAVRTNRAMSIHSLMEGLRFVIKTPIILAATLLDMFAVLFGGAVALLPVFAKDVLGGGPAMLGALRAAPAVGALIMSAIILKTPILNRAGKALLISVALFGAATIAFGLSTSFWLSLIMIGLTGAFDMVSVIVRHTLVQTMTPDALRGRVSAVNGLFISISNELGDVESGFVAKWLALAFLSAGYEEKAIAYGSMATVVIGGIGTILVVFGAMYIAPGLIKLGKLEDLARK